MATELVRHRFTIEQFHLLGTAGVIDPACRVELIEGEVVDMPPIGSGHGGAVDSVAEMFFDRFRERAIVRVQNPVLLPPNSELIPDVALLRRREDHYRFAHPTPEDVLLVVEVSDSTIRTDRGVKAPLYARRGVVETWVIDLDGRAVHVYRQPSDDGYKVIQTLRPGDLISPAAFPDTEIPVAAFFG
ncbi:MAG: Uma2 family endonuclease [Chloroflexota bacterium]